MRISVGFYDEVVRVRVGAFDQDESVGFQDRGGRKAIGVSCGTPGEPIGTQVVGSEGRLRRVEDQDIISSGLDVIP
jgi:hypothetical protein